MTARSGVGGSRGRQPHGWTFYAVALAAVMWASPPALPLDAAGRLVSFSGTDGRPLTGLLVEARDRPAPAVVLAPMLGRPKDDWQATAQQLADANITALAIDLRAATLPSDPQELIKWHEDIVAAVSFLNSRPSDVLTNTIGLAGASLGANLAVLAAVANPGVRSVALVSPSLDYRGVRIDTPWRDYGARPALLIASVHDPYAARSVRELAQDGQGARDVRWSNIAAHGTVLVSRDADLIRVLVEWFQQTLR